MEGFSPKGRALLGIVWGTKKALTEKSRQVPEITGGRGGIRTRGLWLRRPTLYPAELPAL